MDMIPHSEIEEGRPLPEENDSSPARLTKSSEILYEIVYKVFLKDGSGTFIPSGSERP